MEDHSQVKFERKSEDKNKKLHLNYEFHVITS